MRQIKAKLSWIKPDIGNEGPAHSTFDRVEILEVNFEQGVVYIDYCNFRPTIIKTMLVERNGLFVDSHGDYAVLEV